MKTKKIQIDNNQCSKCGKCVKSLLKKCIISREQKSRYKNRKYNTMRFMRYLHQSL